jgi:phosphoglycerol transferase MdoB-like AlkP superfamily enzyme
MYSIPNCIKTSRPLQDGCRTMAGTGIPPLAMITLASNIFLKITLNLGFSLSLISLYTQTKSGIRSDLLFSKNIHLYTLLFILSLSQARTDKKNLNILDSYSFIDFMRLL